MNNFLVLTALGDSQRDWLGELARTVLECKCSIVESRVSVLGQHYGALMLLAGNWNTLAKLEVQLERLAQNAPDGSLQVCTQRTERRPVREDVLPYAVELVALDQPGVVSRLLDFFASRAVQVDDLSCRSFPASHTGATMITVNLVIGIPAEVHVAMLREEFMDFCDQFNWDSVLEPVKA